MFLHWFCRELIPLATRPAASATSGINVLSHVGDAKQTLTATQPSSAAAQRGSILGRATVGTEADGPFTYDLPAHLGF